MLNEIEIFIMNNIFKKLNSSDINSNNTKN